MWLGVLVAACLLGGASSRRWNLMVYFAADNDLDCYAVREVSALAAAMEPLGPGSSCRWSPCAAAGTGGAACGAGSTQRSTRPCEASSSAEAVQRLCCHDRQDGGDAPQVSVFLDIPRDRSSCAGSAKLGSSGGARDLHIAAGGAIEVAANHGEVNSADPEALAGFLERSIPWRGNHRGAASRVGHFLVLWSHGGGWASFGLDESSAPPGQPGPKMDLRGLRHGISQGLARSGLPKLSGIGFDACLMSMLEVANALHPFADFMVSSESYGPVQGWDYRALVRSAGAGAEPGDLFSEAAEKYLQKVEGKRPPRGASLSVVDLGAIPKLAESLQEAAAAYAAAVKQRPGLAARVLQWHFAEAEVISEVEMKASSADLGRSLHHLLALAPLTNADLRMKVQTCLSEYLRAVYAFAADDENPMGCSGLGIYFPKVRRYQYFYNLLVEQFPVLGNWAEFISLLYSEARKLRDETGVLTFLSPPNAAEEAAADRGVDSPSWTVNGYLSAPSALQAELWVGITKSGGRDVIWLASVAGEVDGAEVSASWDGRTAFLSQVIEGPPGHEGYAVTSPVFAQFLRKPRGSSESQQASLKLQVTYGEACGGRQYNGYLLYHPDAEQSRGLTLHVAFEVGDIVSYREVKPSENGAISTFLPRSVVVDGKASYHERLREFSRCFKWGYPGTLKVLRRHVAADLKSGQEGAAFVSFAARAAENATLDAGARNASMGYLDGAQENSDPFLWFSKSLSAQHRREVSMMLVAKDAAGEAVQELVYVGAASIRFTADGCRCKALWNYGGQTFAGCANPSGDPGGPWCYVEPTGACGGDGSAGKGHAWGYCMPSRTLLGCTCLAEWAYDGRSYPGICANPDKSRSGAWCVVDRATCPEPLPEPARSGWDHCQMPTRAACRCASAWQPGGPASIVQFGTCVPARPGDPADGWCMIEEGSCIDSTTKPPAGVSWDWCGPETPSFTRGGTECLKPQEAQPTGNSTGRFYGCNELYTPPGQNATAPGNGSGWCFTGGADWGLCMPEEQAEACNTDVAAACGHSPYLSGGCRSGCLRAACRALRRYRSGVNATCKTDAPIGAVLGIGEVEELVLQAGQGCAPSGASGPDADERSQAHAEAVCDLALGAQCAKLLQRWCGDARLCDNEECSREMCRVRGLLNRGSNAGPPCADPEQSWLLLRNLHSSIAMDCMQDSSAPGSCSHGLPGAATDTGGGQRWKCPRNATINATSGVIGAPLEPGAEYAPGAACTWIISSEHPFVRLDFEQLSTERHHDLVTVHDKFGYSLGNFSGINEGGTSLQVTTDTGTLIVSFSADDTIQGGGFFARFVSAAQELLLTIPCGNETTRGYMEVASGQNASFGRAWAILSPDGDVVTARGQHPGPSFSLPEFSANGLLSLQQRRVPAWRTQPLQPGRLYRENLCLSPGTYRLHVWGGSEGCHNHTNGAIRLALYDPGSSCPQTPGAATLLQACNGSHAFSWPVACNSTLMPLTEAEKSALPAPASNDATSSDSAQHGSEEGKVERFSPREEQEDAIPNVGGAVTRSDPAYNETNGAFILPNDADGAAESFPEGGGENGKANNTSPMPGLAASNMTSTQPHVEEARPNGTGLYADPTGAQQPNAADSAKEQDGTDSKTALHGLSGSSQEGHEATPGAPFLDRGRPGSEPSVALEGTESTANAHQNPEDMEQEDPEPAIPTSAEGEGTQDEQRGGDSSSSDAHAETWARDSEDETPNTWPLEEGPGPRFPSETPGPSSSQSAPAGKEESPDSSTQMPGVLLTAHFLVSDVSISTFYDISEEVSAEIASVLGVVRSAVTIVQVVDPFSEDSQDDAGIHLGQSRNLKGVMPELAERSAETPLLRRGGLLRMMADELYRRAKGAVLRTMPFPGARHLDRHQVGDPARGQAAARVGCPAASLLNQLLPDLNCAAQEQPPASDGPSIVLADEATKSRQRALLQESAGQAQGQSSSSLHDEQHFSDSDKSSEEHSHGASRRTRLQVSLQVLIRRVLATRSPNYAAILRAWMQDSGGLQRTLADLSDNHGATVSSVEVSQFLLVGEADEAGPMVSSSSAPSDPAGLDTGSGVDANQDCTGPWWSCHSAALVWAGVALTGTVLFLSICVLAAQFGTVMRRRQPESNWQLKWQRTAQQPRSV